MKHQTRKRLLAYASLVAMAANTAMPAIAATTGPNDGNTTTPIKHVIIIVGENRTFDNLFATYVPKHGSVQNLLSEGIINANGKPGKNIALAQQYSAVDTTTFSIAPGGKHRYTAGGVNPFPPVMTGGAPEIASDTNPAPFATLSVAEEAMPSTAGCDRSLQLV